MKPVGKAQTRNHRDHRQDKQRRREHDGPDEAPSDALNRILWHDARGWRAPYPAVRQSLFFPMSRDLADDEREVKPLESKGKRDR